METFGCVSCHGGERLVLDADLAHNTMRGGANPSTLSVVETSCGSSNCHSGNECDICGEEIMNQREIKQDGLNLCRACALPAYYQAPILLAAFSV